MAFTSEIVATEAYRAADYAVLLQPELVLHIGELNPRLDALLERAGASGAAFLTAHNPRSEPRSEAENRSAAAELEKMLASANFSRFPAEGRDPRGRWPVEKGALVLGIPRAEAEALGRRFGQSAIVWLAIGAAPELVFLGKTRLVLDTNAWLDWLVFDDPVMKPLRAAVAEQRAEIFVDEACLAELAEVLARPFKGRAIDAAAALAEVKKITSLLGEERAQTNLPACRDPDDQKFLELAAAARADFLITKDTALLELARRKAKPPFHIVIPSAFALRQT